MNTGLFNSGLPENIEKHNYTVARMRETRRRQEVERIRREEQQKIMEEIYKEENEKKQKIMEILESRGIRLNAQACSCCGLDLKVEIDGEVLYDDNLGFNSDYGFKMMEEEE